MTAAAAGCPQRLQAVSIARTEQQQARGKLDSKLGWPAATAGDCCRGAAAAGQRAAQLFHFEAQTLIERLVPRRVATALQLGALHRPAMEQAVAVDRPLKLGSTLLDSKSNHGFFTFKYDFQPDSMQRAETADLIIIGEAQEQVRAPGAPAGWRVACLRLGSHCWDRLLQVHLIPDLPEGTDAHYAFEGKVETLQQKPGADLECVAVFDGSEWTLQLVSAHMRAK